MLISEDFATNPLIRADGSALWTTGVFLWDHSNAGKTKALVSINGPIEVSRRDELVSESTIDIQFRPVSGYPGPHEKTLELQLRQFISSLIYRTLNPRSLIQIVVQILSVDTTSTNPSSTILTTVLNAVMLALLSTPSIPLRTTISAIEVVKAQDVAICHPTEQQKRQATSTHVLAFDSNTRKLVFCESWGMFTIEEWDEVIKAGEKERGIEALMRQQIAKMVGISTLQEDS